MRSQSKAGVSLWLRRRAPPIVFLGYQSRRSLNRLKICRLEILVEELMEVAGKRDIWTATWERVILQVKRCH